MKDVQFTVKQGIIHINSITIFQCTEDVLSFSADTKQKYPVIEGLGERMFFIGANDKTLHIDTKAYPDLELGDNTIISVIGWQEREINTYFDTYTSVGRYSIGVAIVRADLKIAEKFPYPGFTEIE